MATTTAFGQLADLAEAQAGLVTARQAQARGVPRRDLARMANSGGLERIAHGVYRVGGAPRPRLLELRAAWMQLAPDIPADERTLREGVVSHASAATVYDVGLLDPAWHDFAVPAFRRVRSHRSDVVIHAASLKETDIDWVDGLLTTTPARLIADLCATHLDGEHLAGIVADLLAKKLMTKHQIRSILQPYAADYGATPDGFLASLLAVVGVAR